MPWWKLNSGEQPVNDTQDDEVVAPVAASSHVAPASPAVAPKATESHPVLAAALAEGVDTPDKFKSLITAATDGEKYAGLGKRYEANVNTSLAAAAVRLFGPTQGPVNAKAYEHLAVDEKETTAATWNKMADEKFDVTGDGKTKRVSASAPMPSSANAENNADEPARVTALLGQTEMGRKALALKKGA
jgi:hypothetical protein